MSSAETLEGPGWTADDVLRVEVVATDGEADAAVEASVVVANTQPVIASLAIDPSPPMITEEIRAVYTIVDPDDQELMVFLTWYLNGMYAWTGEVYEARGPGAIRSPWS